jgi:hypothetical protein
MIKEGDIVQITNSAHRWFPCLIIVTEVKTWGIQGYITIPNGEETGNAFVRINSEDYKKVGYAIYVRAKEE